MRKSPLWLSPTVTTPVKTQRSAYLNWRGSLANDSDDDDDDLTAVLKTNVSNGTLVLDANGGFSYTPDENFNGPDSFTYAANDGK